MLICWVNLKKIIIKSHYHIVCTLWCNCFKKWLTVKIIFESHVCVESNFYLFFDIDIFVLLIRRAKLIFM